MRTTNYYSRQKHKKALVYLKSGLYCDRKEKQLEYFVVIVSAVLCVLGIWFSILPRIMGGRIANFALICQTTVDYLGVASGVFLIVQLIVKSVTTRLHLEAVSSLERFDNHVYDLPPNRMILRPMTEAQLENYASKIKSADAEYVNPYFQSETPNDPTVVYQNQREIFVNEYHLLLYVRRFSNIMLGLFTVVVFGLAVLADANFLITLQRILFPSISIISILVTVFININKAMRYLQNVLTQYEAVEKDSSFDKRSEMILRQNQDAMFQYRLISPTVPMFLIRGYEKSAMKYLRASLADEEQALPKTSVFMTATVGKSIEKKLARKKAGSEKTAAERNGKSPSKNPQQPVEPPEKKETKRTVKKQ